MQFPVLYLAQLFDFRTQICFFKDDKLNFNDIRQYIDYIKEFLLEEGSFGNNMPYLECETTELISNEEIINNREIHKKYFHNNYEKVVKALTVWSKSIVDFFESTQYLEDGWIEQYRIKRLQARLLPRFLTSKMIRDRGQGIKNMVKHSDTVHHVTSENQEYMEALISKAKIAQLMIDKENLLKYFNEDELILGFSIQI